MEPAYRFDGLKGKVAVVTGASQNLGAAMAVALGRQGCHTAVVGRSNLRGAEDVAGRITTEGGLAHAWCADLTRAPEVDRLFREIVVRLGPVDILVNNAGGWNAPTPFWELTIDGFRDVLASNLESTFLCSQTVLPAMMERRWGRIVNLSSQAGRTARPSGDAGYSAAKGGIDALTRQMASEVGPYGVTVNAIAPGTTLKEAGRKRPDDFYEALAARTSLRRLGHPEDHAAAVCFLSSPAADWITGITLDVDGGGQSPG